MRFSIFIICYSVAKIFFLMSSYSSSVINPFKYIERPLLSCVSQSPIKTCAETGFAGSAAFHFFTQIKTIATISMI